MRFTAATGTSITLADPTVRSQYKGFDFSSTTDDLSDITQDDVVVYGYGSGVSILGPAYDELLVDYTILKIKAALNESDTGTQSRIKDLEDQMKSDRVGRPGIETIERLSRFMYAPSYRRIR